MGLGPPLSADPEDDTRRRSAFGRQRADPAPLGVGKGKRSKRRRYQRVGGNLALSWSRASWITAS